MSHVFVPTPPPERALTRAQKQVLLALIAGVQVDAASVAAATGMKPNGAGLALRGLERRGLIARAAGEPVTWSVTFAGHALAQRLDRVSRDEPEAPPAGAPRPGTPRSGPA